MALQIKRGLEANRLSITPAAGELIFTTDKKNVYVGDGVTPGGIIVSGTGFDSETNKKLRSFNTDSEWVLDNINYAVTILDNKINNLNISADTGTIEGVDFNTTKYDANFLLTTPTRINSGSTNPDINTTINNAAIGNTVEYEILGAFYPANGWLVRKNATTFDTLIIRNGTVVGKQVLNTTDSEDEVLTLFTTALETYVRGDLHDRNKTQNISLFDVFGGKFINLVQNDYSYNNVTTRNKIISDSLYNLLVSVKLLNRSIDSETLARKVQISQLNTSNQTPPDSDWILRVSNPEVDSDWVIRNGGVLPGKILSASMKRGSLVSGNLQTGVFWRINGGSNQLIEAMMANVKVGDYVTSATGLIAQGFYRKFFNDTTDYLVTVFLEGGLCKHKETQYLKGNYTSNQGAVVEAPEMYPLSDGRIVWPNPIPNITSGDFTLHNSYTTDAYYQYSEVSYSKDSDRNVLLDTNLKALRGEITKVNAKLTPMTEKVNRLLDSDNVKKITDSEYVLSKIRDKTTYRIELLAKDNTTVPAVPSNTGNTFTAAYVPSTNTWTFTGTVTPISGAIWTNGNNGSTVVSTIVYVNNGVVQAIARNNTLTTIGTVQSLTINGARYTLGNLSNAIGTLSWNGVNQGSTNLIPYTRFVDSDTWVPNRVSGLDLDEYIATTSASIDYLYQQSQKLNSVSSPVYMSVAGNVYGTSWGGSDFSNTTAGIFQKFPFDVIEYTSNSADFNTTSYEYTVPENGTYSMEIQAIQGATTYATRFRYAHVTTANVTSYSNVTGFEDTSEKFRTSKWIKYCYAGETLHVQFDGTLRTTSTWTIIKL